MAPSRPPPGGTASRASSASCSCGADAEPYSFTCPQVVVHSAFHGTDHPRHGARASLLLVAGALVATYLVAAAVAVRVATRSREVPVPDLAGRTVREAGALLEDRGLTLRVDENRRVHPTVPEGHIAQQDPPAGVIARRPRGVKVWVSLGPRATIVPDSHGPDRADRAAAAPAGWPGAWQGCRRSASAELPRRRRRRADAGRRGRGPTGVAARESRRARPSYVMPDLIGVDGERAAEFLRARGFRVDRRRRPSVSRRAGGIVMRQTPAGGFQIAPGEPSRSRSADERAASRRPSFPPISRGWARRSRRPNAAAPT